MNKRGRIAIFEISNLVLAIIAFSFLIGLSSEILGEVDLSGFEKLTTSGPNPRTFWYNSVTKQELTEEKYAEIKAANTPSSNLAAGTSSNVDYWRTTADYTTTKGVKIPSNSVLTPTERDASGNIISATTSIGGVTQILGADDLAKIAKEKGGIGTPFGNISSIGAPWANALIGSLTWA